MGQGFGFAHFSGYGDFLLLPQSSELRDGAVLGNTAVWARSVSLTGRTLGLAPVKTPQTPQVWGFGARLEQSSFSSRRARGQLSEAEASVFSG